MRQLIKDGVLLDTSGQAPSPSKDFVNLKVTEKEVIWRYWKINPTCLKSDVRVGPSENKQSHEDFLHDYDVQTEVKRFFGANMLQYVKDLCSGHYDYFPRLKNSLQIYIMSFMELEDIGRLAQTSKHFRELCNSEQLWEHIVESHCDTITQDMRMFAGEVGWKHVFFTNKLQLQAQMRRHQQRALFVAKLSDTKL